MFSPTSRGWTPQCSRKLCVRGPCYFLPLASGPGLHTICTALLVLKEWRGGVLEEKSNPASFHFLCARGIMALLVFLNKYSRLQYSSHPHWAPISPPLSRRSPQWKWTPYYGYTGEDEVYSKFPTPLARQPPGRSPTFCKSSLANQNSCWEPPDPEFPDKEMFMLSLFFLPFTFFWSELHRAKSGAGKKATHTLDLKCRVQAHMGRSAGLFVVDSAGDGVHVWVELLEEEYADFRYFQETCYGPSALKETRLFKTRVPDRAQNTFWSARQNGLHEKNLL